MVRLCKISNKKNLIQYGFRIPFNCNKKNQFLVTVVYITERENKSFDIRCVCLKLSMIGYDKEHYFILNKRISFYSNYMMAKNRSKINDWIPPTMRYFVDHFYFYLVFLKIQIINNNNANKYWLITVVITKIDIYQVLFYTIPYQYNFFLDSDIFNVNKCLHLKTFP